MLQNTLRTLAIPALLLATAAPAVAQNLLKNGDFEASKILIAPWKVGGTGADQRVEEKNATNGATPSNAFAVTVSAGQVHQLSQPVGMKKGQPYVLRMNLHGQRLSTSWNYVDIFVEIRSGTQWTRVWQQRLVDYRPEHTLRSFGAKFTPALDASEIRILYTTYRYGKYRIFLDDVTLRPHTDMPVLSSPSNKSLAAHSDPATLRFEILGGKGVANYVFLSLKRLPGAGVTIPGFQNKFQLDLSAGLLAPLPQIVTDQTCLGSLTLKLKKSILNQVVGVPLHLQPIAFNPIRGILECGPAMTMGLVK